MLLLRGAAARSAPSPGRRWSDACGDVLAGPAGAGAPPPAGGAARERWESLAALVDLADDLAAEHAGRRTSPASSPSWTERAAAQHAPTVQGVTLASLHAAKGLEWDAVFLVGLVDGTLPIPHVADRRSGSRRSGGCSTSASPGPGSS